MELVIDIGNTRIKWALFSENELKSHGTIDKNDALPKQFQEPLISGVLISKVSIVPASIERWAYVRDDVLWLSSGTELPFSSIYRTPETLGLDRLANAAAAISLGSGPTSIVIDTGTCITMDLVHHGVYSGGVITPGLNMRARALNNYTDGLPLVNLSEPEQLEGLDTTQSILSGVINGAIAEMNGMIESFKLHYGDLEIFLTGGDMQWFEHVLKSETFADAFFTLRGLNAILQHNRS